MTSRERVRRAIHFNRPDRVPLWMADKNFDLTNDIYRTSSKTFTPLPEEKLRELVPDFDGKLSQTEWGNITGKLNTSLSTSLNRFSCAVWNSGPPLAHTEFSSEKTWAYKTG